MFRIVFEHFSERFGVFSDGSRSVLQNGAISILISNFQVSISIGQGWGPAAAAEAAAAEAQPWPIETEIG